MGLFASFLFISSMAFLSETSEYLKLNKTSGVMPRALHISSKVSAETKLFPNSIWLKQ